VQRVTDLTNLPAIWTAARAHLARAARTLESVLGACTRVDALDVQTGELTLVIPDRFTNFTNEMARTRIKESLSAVTGLPIRLTVNFIEMAMEPPPPAPGMDAQSFAAQRVPPELLEKVKSTALVKELMKRLDATVTLVEIVAGEEPPEPPAGPGEPSAGA
jgi:hypothetical protein